VLWVIFHFFDSLKDGLIWIGNPNISKKGRIFLSPYKSNNFKGLWVIVQFFPPFSKKRRSIYHLTNIYNFYWSSNFFPLKKVRSFFITIKKFIGIWVIVQFFRASYKMNDHFITLLTFIILIGSSNFFDPLKIGRSFLSPYTKSWFCWFMNHRPML
jgi:hypothetical protein